MNKELLELLTRDGIAVNATWPTKVAYAKNAIDKLGKNTVVDLNALQEFFAGLAFLDLEKSEIEKRNLTNHILHAWEAINHCLQTLQMLLHTPKLLENSNATVKQQAFILSLQNQLVEIIKKYQPHMQKFAAAFAEQQKIKKYTAVRLEQARIEEEKIATYPGYQNFQDALRVLPKEKQDEVNFFIATLSQQIAPNNEKHAWQIIQPFLSELINIKKGKNGVDSLPQIAAFIKNVKALFSPATEAINNILRKTVGRELLQAAYPSQDKVVSVRLWLSAEELRHSESRTILGVKSGGHLSIQIYESAEKQQYFAFGATQEKIGQPTILAQLAKKLGLPGGNDRKGAITETLIYELDKVYFQGSEDYAGFREVIIPMSEIGVLGLSADNLERWMSNLERNNLTYNFYANNCSTFVASALEAGDAERFKSAPTYLGGVKTPKAVFAYAQTIAEEIKHQQTNLDNNKKQSLLKAGGVKKAKSTESIVLEAPESYLAYTDIVLKTNRKPMSPEQFQQEQAHKAWRATLSSPKLFKRNTIAALSAAFKNSNQKKELLFDLAFLGIPFALEENQKHQQQLCKTLTSTAIDPTESYDFKKALLNDVETIAALTKNTTNRGWVVPLLANTPDLVQAKLKPGFWYGMWQRMRGTDIRQAIDVATLVDLAKHMMHPEDDLIDVLLKKPNILQRFSGQPNYREMLLADKEKLAELINYFIDEQPSAEVLQKICSHVDIETCLGKEIANKIKDTLQACKVIGSNSETASDLTASTNTDGYSSDSDINQCDVNENENAECAQVPTVKMK